MGKGKNQFKIDLHCALSRRERDALAKLLTERSGYSHRSLSDHLNSVSAHTLSVFLHEKLFGTVVEGNEACAVVMENIDRVKDFLGRISPYPLIPSQLYIDNQYFKKVLVSVHAWERFCERFCPLELSSEAISGTLKKSFTRAKLVELERRHAVIRFISNGFIEAKYFLDKSLSCRFVVALEDDKPILMTVEIPH